MTSCKRAMADAAAERSAGRDAEVSTGDIVDDRHGGPVTIGSGRYGPDQALRETIAVDDVMVVLDGRPTVTSVGAGATAGLGGTVAVPRGGRMTLRAHETGP